jgi:hypothetical protein
MNRIDSDANDKEQTGFWSGNNALWRNVAVGISRKDEKASTAGVGYDDLAILLIYSQGMRPDQARVRSLNRPYGRLFSNGSATKSQHGCPERDRHDDLVVSGIVGQAMHGST